MQPAYNEFVGMPKPSGMLLLLDIRDTKTHILTLFYHGRVDNPNKKIAKELKDGKQRHAFNEYVSDLISVNRSLPDFRDPWCRSVVMAENVMTPDT